MSIFSKLFGGVGKKTPELVYEDYKGFRIAGEPILFDGQYRIGARIEKEVDGEVKTHHLIRADLLRDWEEAVQASVNKAKVMIDQVGDGVFSAPGPEA